MLRRSISIMTLGALVLLAGCNSGKNSTRKEPVLNQKANSGEASGIATFAGGCFWCMEPPFEALKGVSAVISGYTGGKKKNPTYEEVSSGSTGHTEAIRIEYDPNQVSYEKLLEVFWMNIDPTAKDRQFVDVGAQYRSGVFYHSEAQRIAAEESKQKLATSGRFKEPIVTEITQATEFYPAEDYHQDYYKKNPLRYKFYRYNSGRDQFLEKKWKK